MRHLRVFKIRNGETHVWIVASQSLRDDETWDEIHRTATRGQAFAYLDMVTKRNNALVAAGCP